MNLNLILYYISNEFIFSKGLELNSIIKIFFKLEFNLEL